MIDQERLERQAMLQEVKKTSRASTDAEMKEGDDIMKQNRRQRERQDYLLACELRADANSYEMAVSKGKKQQKKVVGANKFTPFGHDGNGCMRQTAPPMLIRKAGLDAGEDFLDAPRIRAGYQQQTPATISPSVSNFNPSTPTFVPSTNYYKFHGSPHTRSTSSEPTSSVGMWNDDVGDWSDDDVFIPNIKS